MAEPTFTLALLTFLMLIVIKGMVQVFKDHFWLAALMLICFFPLLLLWSLVEGLFNWR